MTFEELWSQVNGLPNTAIQEIPRVLSEKTKMKLSKRSQEEVQGIIAEAIAEINQGSVIPLEELVRQRL